MRNATITTLTIVALGGCTIEAGDTTFPEQELEPSAPVDAGSFDTDVALGSGSGAGTMTGTWLQLHEASTCVVIAEQVTWAAYLLNIEQDNRTLSETRTLCEFELSPVLGLEIVIPPAVVASIEVVDIDNGYVSSLTPGGTYSSATEVGLWGVELDDPLSDPIPEDPESPVIIDADDDGNPGVTFAVAGSDCERYVAQRSIVRYTGAFTTPNQIDGTSITVTDSEVLGSSQRLCGVSPRLTANDAYSRFRMVRVDGTGESIDLDDDGDGSVTCEEVRPWIDQLIERREATPENCE